MLALCSASRRGRAIQTHEGYLDRDGVRIFYEVYGTRRAHASCCFPTWEIVHSRAWKSQIPYFARHGRVVTFDRRGNGRSDRPAKCAPYDRRAPP